MIGALTGSSELLRNPLASRVLESEPFSGFRPHQIEKVVVGGMGGSAIAGDVIVNWLSGRLEIPIVVVRNRSLPRFVDNRTLFIALSYSGETFETLGLYRAAGLRGCSRVGIGTGGSLARLCALRNEPYLAVRPTVAPRAALHQMVAACAIVFEEARLARKITTEIHQVANEIEGLRPAYETVRHLRSNPAKQFALSLRGRSTAIYALQQLSSVARRFKNQLNENTKVPARYDLLPEAGHNEVEAWSNRNNDLLPVFVRDTQESSWERKMLDSFRRTILGSNRTAHEVRVTSYSKLGRLMAPIFFLDYVSIYLAYLNNIDPTPTPMIKQYRQRVT